MKMVEILNLKTKGKIPKPKILELTEKDSILAVANKHNIKRFMVLDGNTLRSIVDNDKWYFYPK